MDRLGDFTAERESVLACPRWPRPLRRLGPAAGAIPGPRCTLISSWCPFGSVPLPAGRKLETGVRVRAHLKGPRGMSSTRTCRSLGRTIDFAAWQDASSYAGGSGAHRL